MQEKVVHQKNVHFADVLHFDGVYAVDLSNHALLVFFQVHEVLGQAFEQHLLLTVVHSLD